MPARDHLSPLAERLRTARAKLAEQDLGGEPGDAIIARPGEEATLSEEQRRVWLVDQILGGSPDYNVPHGVTVTGPFDPKTFATALTAVVARHEVLRTRYVEQDGGPRPVVDPPARITVPVLDLRHLGTADDPGVMEVARAEIDRPFDLAVDLPIRSVVLRCADSTWLLLVTVHHIATDAQSTVLLWSELSEQYRRTASGAPLPLDPPPLRYADFAAWEQERFRTGTADLDAGLAYWSERLADVSDLPLPIDRPRPSQRTRRGAEVRREIPADVMERLRTLGAAQGASAFMTLLAGFSHLLSVLGGQTDVVVGSPVLGRDRPELESVIGSFVNVLVLRNDLGGTPTFCEVVRRVRRGALDAYAHQETPFARLVEHLRPSRQYNSNPLFQVMFTVAEQSDTVLDVPALVSRPVELPVSWAKFDLNVTVLTDAPDGSARCCVSYAEDVFDEETVEHLVEDFLHTLDEATRRPDQPMSDLPLFEEERDDGVTRGPAREVGKRTLLDLIAQQAAKTPHAPAVGAGDTVLSYSELMARARGLAEAIRTRDHTGIGAVAVCLGRSPLLPAALIGVWLAGSYYVPIDPAYGRRRVEYMVRHSGARTVIVDSGTASATDWAALGVRTVDVEAAVPATADAAPAGPLPHHLAYVIYTSGSTGRPKGVMVTHEGVANFTLDMTERIGIGPTDKVGAVTTVSFDIAVLELLVPLAAGARVELIPRNVTADGVRMGSLMESKGITVLQATPAGWSLLIASGWPGAPVRALCGGEALPGALARDIHSRVARLWNVYGPTETTIWSAVQEVDSPPAGAVGPPLGKPLANTALYVLDRRLKRVRRGAVGELCVGGAGVARGYVDDPALTASRFVCDPFSDVPGARMYRTGDQVRQRPDGSLQFLGRIDHQVKIRGYRIELEEIEARLLAHPAVAQAVVQASGAGLDQYLAAFIVSRRQQETHPADLRAHLLESLPDYMVPTRFVELDRMPTTPNGKIDRRALPDVPAQGRAGRTAPQTALEERIAQVWCRVLGVERLGVQDDFFALGGHSLRATRLAAELRAELARDVPVQLVFQHPTVRGLAQVLEAAAAPEQGPLPRASERAPLSFVQQRMAFLDRLVPGRVDYNVSSTMRLTGPLDPGALHQALLRVRERHEVLRTRFVSENGRPVQMVEPVLPLWEAPVDFSQHGEDALRRAIEDLCREVSVPFDLTRGPLMRARLLRIAEDEHVLCVMMHHAVVDGWSLPILWAEVSAVYRALRDGTSPELADLPLQYGDFAAWERDRTEPFKEDTDYWRERLRELVPTEIRGARARPAAFDPDGRAIGFEVDTDLGDRVLERARDLAVTPFMVLLGAFMVTVGLLAGRRDVVIGMPIAGYGRTVPGLAGVIGPFLNTVALRAEVGDDSTFEQLLTVLRHRVAEAHAHQGLPFEALVEQLRPDRDLARHPLFQIMFSYDQDDAHSVDLPGVTAQMLDLDMTSAKFDLSMSLVRRGEQLTGSLLYATSIYDHGFGQRVTRLFQRVLHAVTTHPAARLALLEVAEPVEPLETQPAARDDHCLHQLVRDAVARHPHATAVVCGNESVDYAELDRRSDSLAERLQRRSARPGRVIAVLLPRSIDLVVAFLGVLKSGATCLLLDRRQPEARHQALLADAGADILVAEDGTPANAPVREVVPVLLEADSGRERTPAPADGDVTPADIAYVTYTSGSTGRPKMVPASHAAAAGYLRHLIAEYELGEQDVVLQLAAPSFDAAVRDILGPLAAGARLVMLPEDKVGDPRAILDEAARNQATALLSVVPTLLAALTSVQDCPPVALRLVLTSGEALTPRVAEALRRLSPAALLVNQYGPTECTMTSTFHKVTDADLRAGRIPVGAPIPGSQALVLNAAGRRLPDGAVGELYLGGPRVSLGYPGQPALTADRFVPNPFGPPGSRMYRTGDLVRLGTDGNLEFLGRMDHQVKIRGVRVEPSEIESVLGRQPGVRSAAVLPLGQAESVELVAYLAAPAELDITAVRRAVMSLLPEQMHPARYVRRDALPVNAHGKVDRAALARLPLEPDPVDTDDLMGPRDPVEVRLVRIWEEVLDRSPIGIRQDFFELGGHSLKAVDLVEAIAQRMQVSLPLNTVFLHRTVEGMAGAIAGSGDGAGAGSLVVPLNRSSRKAPPLFLVHAQSGDVSCYVDVARELRNWRPVYGIEAVGFHHGDTPLTDVVTMARRYVRQMRAVAPTGPYLLAGWSFGGNVALEMARLLEADGERVAFLGVIDARAFGTDEVEQWYENTAESARFGLAHGLGAGDMDEATPEEILGLLTRRLVQEEKVTAYADTQTLQRMFAIFNANGRAAQTYRPVGPVQADIVLFKTTETHPTLNNPTVRPDSWRRRTLAGLRTVDIPGNHHDLLSQAHTKEFSALLQAAVDDSLVPRDPVRGTAGRLAT